MIIITGTARVHPDQRDAAIAAARDMHKRTIDEPGCVDYRFWSATDDPNAILLFERWQSSRHCRPTSRRRTRPRSSRRSDPPSMEPSR
jgi:quinol monooxygenase YgiN